jgi:hypothetical protein
MRGVIVEITRYDHAEGWAQEYCVSVQVMQERLKGLTSFPVWDQTRRSVQYYDEQEVRKVCADLLVRTRPIGELRR